MTTMYETEQVLMAVKTYPVPSASYGETVCTAGIRLRDGAWVRIYPYPFRLLELENRFEKWQILEMPLVKASRDPRPESYKLFDTNSVRHIRSIDTENGTWAERLRYLRPTVMPSVEAVLNGIPPKGDQNWGATIRPVEVQSGSAKFSYEPVGAQWSKEELAKLERAEERARGDLFNPPLPHEYKRLRKVPYRFRLRFKDLTGAEYKYPILDWEIAQLFFRMQEEHQSDEVALEKVRYKIEEEIFSPSKQIYLILGNTHFEYKQRVLAVDGFVYPKRAASAGMPSLFED